MLRRAPLSLVLSLLLFAPACKKKDSEVTDEAKPDEAKKDEAKQDEAKQDEGPKPTRID